MKNFLKNENVQFAFFSGISIVIFALYAWLFFSTYNDLYTALVFLICNLVFVGFFIAYKLCMQTVRVVNLIYLLLINTFNVTVFTEVLNGGGIHFSNAALFGVNLLLYAVPSILLFAITNSAKVAVFVSDVLFMITGALNAGFLILRGRPFYLHDLPDVGQVFNADWSSADVPALIAMMLGYVFLIFLCLLMVDFFGQEDCSMKAKFRWIAVPVSIVCAAVVVFAASPVAVYDYESHARNGFAVNIAAEISCTFSEKPSGYTDEAALDLLTGESDRQAGKKPNVIVIVDSAFADVRIVGNFQTNRAVTPYIDSLYRNTLSGYAYVPTFGGDTSAAEYELLTGNTSAFDAHAKNLCSVSASGSLIEQFHNLGYTTALMAPGKSTDAYSQLPFDERYFADSYSDARTLRGKVSDESCFAGIIDRFENKSQTDSLFIYAVTDQNTGMYGARTEDFNQQIYLTDERGKYPKAEQYLSLMYETDKAVKGLVEYFKDVSEPTVILFVGAGQGNVEQEFYEKLYGKSIGQLSREEAQRRYTSRFFIWANFGAYERNYMNISVNYLSTLLMKTAALPSTPQQQYLWSLFEKYPVISIAGIHNNTGKYYPAAGRSGECYTDLKNYHMLVYAAERGIL